MYWYCKLNCFSNACISVALMRTVQRFCIFMAFLWPEDSGVIECQPLTTNIKSSTQWSAYIWSHFVWLSKRDPLNVATWGEAS
jgi:ABC-type uncharacterized transport system YnjBCD permease subunit